MNYTEIVNAAKAYVDRVDSEISTNVTLFITMAESRINRALRIGEQTHRVYTASVEGREYYTLPPEYNGMRVLHFNTDIVDSDNSKVITVDYITPEQIAAVFESGNSEYYYTIINNQIQFHPKLPGGGTIEMVFYRRVPPLTSTDNTNWLSLTNPDIYIAAICCEIELFVKNVDLSSIWNERMTAAIADIKMSDIDKRWTGVGLTMRAL